MEKFSAITRSPFTLFAILAILLVGIGGLVGITSQPGIQSWYATLQKPSFNPPNWIFPVVWPLLYVLMAISLTLILKTDHATPQAQQHKKLAIGLFIAMLAVNYAWNPIFFIIQSLWWASFWAYLLVTLTLATAFSAYKVNKTAAVLLLPTLVWESFASVLVTWIYWFN